ncbi:MAG: hypothetical protein HRU43_03555 [Simkaniaceae bacterium]|nr:hypothetical protein [Simkaniaceae bacterium]
MSTSLTLDHIQQYIPEPIFKALKPQLGKDDNLTKYTSPAGKTILQ